MSRFLAKVRREKAEVILVAPVWKAQPWWPDLEQMRVGQPLVLEREQGMFSLPKGFQQEQIQPPKWKLIACKVSGTS